MLKYGNIYAKNFFLLDMNMVMCTPLNIGEVYVDIVFYARLYLIIPRAERVKGEARRVEQ